VCGLARETSRGALNPALRDFQPFNDVNRRYTGRGIITKILGKTEENLESFSEPNLSTDQHLKLIFLKRECYMFSLRNVIAIPRKAVNIGARGPLIPSFSLVFLLLSSLIFPCVISSLLSAACLHGRGAEHTR
jgi:hypothetical protein